ncbi:MAG: hypothetical protein BYD32DRAFT_419443 [Podila humilis]|nr:MAG: hypothetical protein BYD32DRAFT_419443 [Podila humilis]
MIVLRSLSGMILLFSTFLLSTPHTAIFTHAQSDFTPTQNWAAGSFFIEGKALYIMGGAYTPNSLTDVTLRQTYSLDLSTSWNITAPKYTKMTDGIYDYNFPNALMQDGVNWFAVSNQTYYTYNINTGVTTANNPIANLNNITGIRAAMNPTTGDIILPNGYNSSANIASTMRFSPGNQQVSSIEPFSGTASLAEYGIVWSDSAKAMFIFGGYTRATFSTYGTVSSNFIKYDPATSTWSYITSAGGPSARRAPCMISANGGTKIIVFGGTGQSDSLPALGDIYFYDVPTSKWSRGVDSSSKAFRAAHACAVTGDYFIAHGGYAIAQTSSPLSEMTSVYNMKTSTWEDQYIAPSSGGGGGGGDTTTPSGSGSSKGGIIGGVAAAVVVILAGVAFLIYRKKKKGSSDAKPLIVEFDLYSKPSHSYGDSSGQGVASAPVIFGQPSHAIQPTSDAIFSTPMSGTVFESQPATSAHYNAYMSGSVHNPQSLPDPNYTSSIQLTPTSQYAHLSTSSSSPTISTTINVPGSMPTISPTSQYPPSPVPVVYNPAAQSVVFQPNQPFQPLTQQAQPPQNPQTILAQDQQHGLQQTELQHQIEYQEAQLQALREQHRAQQQQQYSHQPPVVSKPDRASIVYSGQVQTPANPQYIPTSGATTAYVWHSAEPTPPRNPQEMRR